MLDSGAELVRVELEQDGRREGEASMGSRASVPGFTAIPNLAGV